MLISCSIITTHALNTEYFMFDALGQSSLGAEDEKGDEEVDAQYQRHFDMREPDIQCTRRKRKAAVSMIQLA